MELVGRRAVTFVGCAEVSHSNKLISNVEKCGLGVLRLSSKDVQEAEKHANLNGIHEKLSTRHKTNDVKYINNIHPELTIDDCYFLSPKGVLPL